MKIRMDGSGKRDGYICVFVLMNIQFGWVISFAGALSD